MLEECYTFDAYYWQPGTTPNFEGELTWTAPQKIQVWKQEKTDQVLTDNNELTMSSARVWFKASDDLQKGGFIKFDTTDPNPNDDPRCEECAFRILSIKITHGFDGEQEGVAYLS